MLSADALKKFLAENRIYALMLAFIIVFEVSLALCPVREEEEAKEKKKVHRIMSAEEMIAQEDRIKEILSDNKPLAAALAVSAFACSVALLAGLILGINCLARKLNGHNIMAAYGSPPDVRWGMIDIFRIALAFYFFGYLLQWIEISLAHMMGIRDVDEKLFIVINATLMDIIGLLIVLYFALRKFRGGLSSLGIGFKNLMRDIKIGLGGYLTLVPILMIIMIFVFISLRVFNYEPPETKALEILYEMDRPKLLFVLTGLVTLLGPVMEEFFFRGFAYPVARKKIGARNAIILISVVFAMLHLNVVSFFPILALGFLLAYLYEKTGSLIPSITVHVVHNTAVVFFVYLYKLIALPK